MDSGYSSKTNCLIKGKSPVKENPVCTVDGTVLSVKDGLETNALVEIWKKGCSPVLTYRCETVNMSKTNKQNINKHQTRLLKTLLGIKHSARNKPFIHAIIMRGQCNRYYFK